MAEKPAGPSTGPSHIRRLLEELSWEGNARRYRRGGLGLENVLTVEVFQTLDFLPRAAFLGGIVDSLLGGDPETLRLLRNEVEEATISLLPGDICLDAQPNTGKKPFYVQPDGIISTQNVYCLIEIKPIKAGSFQPEQLARELVITLDRASAQGQRPLLLLVIPKPPPVPVKGLGLMSIEAAVAYGMPPVMERWELQAPSGHDPTRPWLQNLATRVDLGHSVGHFISYVTWDQIALAIETAVSNFQCADSSVRYSVVRLTNALLEAIRSHS